VLRMFIGSNQRYWQDPAETDWGFAGGALADPQQAWLGMISADMNRVAALKSRTAKLPRIERVGSCTANNLKHVTQNTPTPSGQVILDQATSVTIDGTDYRVGAIDATPGAFTIGPEYAGKLIVVRMKALMSVESGSGNLFCAVMADNYQEINAQVLQSGEAGNVAPIIQTPANQTDPMSAYQHAVIATVRCDENMPGNAVRASAWCPLPNFRDPNGGMGRVNVCAWASGNASGTIATATIEIGFLDY